MLYEIDNVSLMTSLTCFSDINVVHICVLGLHIFILRKVVLQNLEDKCIDPVFSANAHGDNDNSNHNRTIYIYQETSITKHLTKYTQESIHQIWPPPMFQNAIILLTVHTLSITVLNIKVWIAGKCLQPLNPFANWAYLFKIWVPEDRLLVNAITSFSERKSFSHLTTISSSTQVFQNV